MKASLVSGQIMLYNKPFNNLHFSVFIEKYRTFAFCRNLLYRLGLYKKTSVRYFSVKTSSSVIRGLIIMFSWYLNQPLQTYLSNSFNNHKASIFLLTLICFDSITQIVTTQLLNHGHFHFSQILPSCIITGLQNDH